MIEMKLPAPLALLLLFFLLAAVPVTAKEKQIKIGLSISDFETVRWSIEQSIMLKLAYKQGARLISQVANHEPQLQNDQIRNMVMQGVDVIIIIAEDGTAAASAVESAAKEGVPCIAYDRLIKSDKLAAYISFDNVAVGRTQAHTILKKAGKGNYVMLGGSPTDNNAVLLRKGQMEIIQPLVDKGDIKIVADRWVKNWSPANATKIMEDILSSAQDRIDAVIASNDGTALGAIRAMKTRGLTGKVPISGQDATAAGCKSIVEGELTMTVFKDVRQLSPMAMDMAMKLAKGEKIDGLKHYTLKELTLDETLKGAVPCIFLEVLGIDKGNVYDEIVRSGFQSYDDIYKDIAADKRPPRP